MDNDKNNKNSYTGNIDNTSKDNNSKKQAFSSKDLPSNKLVEEKDNNKNEEETTQKSKDDKAYLQNAWNKTKETVTEYSSKAKNEIDKTGYPQKIQSTAGYYLDKFVNGTNEVIDSGVKSYDKVVS